MGAQHVGTAEILPYARFYEEFFINFVKFSCNIILSAFCIFKCQLSVIWTAIQTVYCEFNYITHSYILCRITGYEPATCKQLTHDIHDIIQRSIVHCAILYIDFIVENLVTWKYNKLTWLCKWDGVRIFIIQIV